jgi:thiol-disulfide isomerase/thioredoxin
MSRVRDRAMDVLTVGILLAALGVFFWRSRPSDAQTTPSTAQAEADLVKAAPDTLLAVRAGETATQVVDFRGDSATLIMMFTTTCPWCKKMKADWEQVANLQSPAVRVMAFANEPPSLEAGKYFGSTRIRILQALSARDMRRVFPVEPVPVTLAVKGGRVLAAHVGYGTLADIERIAATLAAK